MQKTQQQNKGLFINMIKASVMATAIATSYYSLKLMQKDAAKARAEARAEWDSQEPMRQAIYSRLKNYSQ
jgi:hypothetical protein